MKTDLHPRPRCEQRTLLIDDDPLVHRQLAEWFRSAGIELRSAFGDEQALTIAAQEEPDLILLGHAVSGAPGIELLREIRQETILASTPVILITENTQPEWLAACFAAGATDYLGKPLCAPELLARVRSVLERGQLQEALTRTASHDPLTALPNRNSICQRIQSVLDQGCAAHAAVLTFDLDRFKLVNDAFGHEAGDQLLQQIAARLGQPLQLADQPKGAFAKATAARLGGDEFAILLEDLADPEDALRIADQLLAALQPPYGLAGQQVGRTSRGGVVNGLHTYAKSEDVLRDAETARRAAKLAGQGRNVLFDTTMHEDAPQRLRMEHDLRQAIENHELFLVYQPIVSLETGETMALEALIRWEHPERGLVMPMDFLPTAVETGLIVDIGTFALDQGCAQLAAWRRSLGTAAPRQIHINLSRKQLTGDLVDVVLQTLAKHGIDPQALHLEVTESEIMQNAEVARKTLGALREIGVKIDMDDFGTGHSSLSCLQELPIDVLKIDRAFISNMERSYNFAALVHAVTSLGQNLGMATVAEGIETAEQLAMVQTMGCEYGQGYFFAKPLLAEHVPAHMFPAGPAENSSAFSEANSPLLFAPSDLERLPYQSKQS